MASISRIISSKPFGLNVSWYWFAGILIVTVALLSRVAILKCPGDPPVFPRWDSSGTTNQNSVSTWAKILPGRVINNRKKNCQVYAVDIPSGLEGETGKVETEAMRTDWTLTVHAIKTGLISKKAKRWVGRIEVVSMGVN